MTNQWPGSSDMAGAREELAERLPNTLRPLAELAMNYRWSWMPGGPELFQELDRYRWGLCGRNPVHLLEEASEDRIQAAARDSAYIDRANRLLDAVRADLDRPPAPGWDASPPAAYLCAEFAVHRSMPVYAGGLGVLAGDILKECSDRAIPMLGVGLMYRQGYLHQRIDGDGQQHEYWARTDPDRLPAALVTRDGKPLVISVPVAGRTVVVQVWRVDVGRVPLYLLDSERPENSRVDRWITTRLYVGDHATRLAQYVLLGVGAVRALRAMGIDAATVHLNEGHAALAAVELLREQMAAGRDLGSAAERVRENVTFTTHTPVAAGNEFYPTDEALGILSGALDLPGAGSGPAVDLGRFRAGSGDFGLAPLGFRLSRVANGVSRRHTEVARDMWQGLQPGRPQESPIIGITNGVHLPTWIAPPMRALLDEHLGPGWIDHAADAATWAPVASIPDAELWEVRRRQRSYLIERVRNRSTIDRLARGEPGWFVEAAAKTFDPEVLTIGFARRIASYKRLHLLVHDTVRAVGLLSGPRPVQIVLAGKAHPQDEKAKGIVKQLFALKWEEHVAGRVVYLEDYALEMAAQLVAGCDVWLNLPRPPQEASGTSGMKAAANGGLNLSVLDGW
ncbi:MAG TPA: alpha-glucan family phosphorylase, partial [Candidatus Sulfotelmatobacter sp.]|nr:alpha-glucan family phosphorylase [Candidatus Sulfotelmatobacter sp.]